MGIQPDRKNRQDKNRRKGGGGRFQPRTPDYPKPTCGICAQPIKDVTSALARPDDTAPVHFDCALNSLREILQPGEGEMVIYLGRGSFAVVDVDAYKKRRLKILRRTDWETPEHSPSWRKDLSKTVY